MSGAAITTAAITTADGITWHVERAGTAGPLVLLLHGTGASTHSWRDVIPLLAPQFHVLALDLPGQARTTAPAAFKPTLDGMADAVGSLLTEIDAAPAIIAGHSAGAAVAMAMVLRGMADPQMLVSFNGALLPFQGPAGHVFPVLARLLYLNPLTQRFFAWRSERPETIARLIRDTGSMLTEDGLEHYRRLFRDPAHLHGTLSMMAHWDLHAFQRALPDLRTPVLLLAGSRDRAVPPGQADRAATLIPQATVRRLPDLGHLAHEERPDLAARLIAESA